MLVAVELDARSRHAVGCFSAFKASSPQKSKIEECLPRQARFGKRRNAEKRGDEQNKNKREERASCRAVLDFEEA